jgi:plastocyanin
MVPSASPAASVPAQIIAGPGAFVPYVTYLTPRVVVDVGKAPVFRNLDPAIHDVQSIDGFFSTNLIGIGGSEKIAAVAGLPVGAYSFYCSRHFWMKGQILIRSLPG